MDQSEISQRQQADVADPIPWVALLLLWALTAALYAAKAVFSAATTPLILDTDDAMRLTEVHDFLAGQGWYDLIQHRLNTPWGGSIHWSRLVDLPEAIVLGALRTVLPLDKADIAAAYLWPLLLMGPLFCLTAAFARFLGGSRAVVLSLLMSAASLVTMSEFAPGRFDHHSMQILLSLAMVLSTLLSLERPRFALAAGVAAAAALAIGVEGLPIVGATVLAFGVTGALEPRHAVAMRDFGLSFALAATVALAIGVAPGHWLSPSVDAISIVYVTGAVLCSLAFTVLSLLPIRNRLSRFAVGAGAGVFVLLIVLLLFPQVLKGPYGAVDPWLQAHWLNRISEAESWFQTFNDDPVYPLAVGVPVILAILVSLSRSLDPRRHQTLWRIALLFLLISAAMMALQIRAVRIAVPLAVPVTAAFVAELWAHGRERFNFRRLLTLTAASFSSMGIIVAVVVVLLTSVLPANPGAAADPDRDERNRCVEPQAFAELSRLPPQGVMTPIDLGSHTLLYTQHSVVSAPYHRNSEAVLDTFHFFNGPIEAARDILARRGVSLLVICPKMPEVSRGTEPAPDSFVALYAKGKLPKWLVEQSTRASVLKIYRVMPR